jgi:hypothetical protein
VLHGFKPESTRHFLPLDASATLWRQDEDMEGDAQRDAESCRKTLNDLLARPTLGEEGRTLAQYLFLCEESMSSSDNQDHVDLPQFFIVKEGYPTLGRLIARGASGAVLAVSSFGMPCAKKFFRARQDEGSMKENYTRGEPVGEIELPSL